MKSRMYELLVNRVPGIRDRYRLKKSQNGSGPWAAGIYLLWLNVQYYLLFQKKLGQPVRAPLDTEKELYWAGSESSLSQRESPEALADRLAAYDVISFDVFDTLIFRPFSSPGRPVCLGRYGVGLSRFSAAACRCRTAGPTAQTETKRPWRGHPVRDLACDGAGNRNRLGAWHADRTALGTPVLFCKPLYAAGG